MKLTKEQKQYVFLGVLAVPFLYVVYFNYIMIPLNQDIRRLRGEVESTNSKVEEMKRRAAQLPALRAEHDALEEEVGRTEKKLPREKSVENVLRIVTEQSQKFGVVVGSFSPGGEVSKQYYVEVPINLSFSGSYHMVARFLAALGLQERIVNSQNLNLNAKSNDTRGHTVTGTVVLMAFAYQG